MGNSESMYESQDNFYQHPPSYNNSYHQPSPYAENSENTTYHEPSSYAWNSSNTAYYQPSTYARSSKNTCHQHKRQPTYIADNFSYQMVRYYKWMHKSVYSGVELIIRDLFSN